MNRNGRPRLLVVDYLCVPGRGSERGAGWGILRALQRFADCRVITGPESAAALEAWIGQYPDTTLEVELFAEPTWAPPLKRHRFGEFIVYLVWQRRARRHLRQRNLADRFDAVVHVTLSAFWLPAMATEFDAPSVWGPVGGAVVTPRGLWPLLGPTGIFVELVDLVAVRLLSWLPGTRRTWRTATVRVAQNPDTVRRLPADLRPETRILNHALFHDVEPPDLGDSDPSPYVAWVSPMESRKGPELAVRAFAETAGELPMVMVGDGPERARMEALAQSLSIADRISFAGLVPHDRALRYLREAAVAVFTGMREEGGLALAEAMLLGTPVVVLDVGGAGVIARGAVDPTRVTVVAPTTVQETVTAMARAIDHHIARTADETDRERLPLLDRDAANRELEEIVRCGMGSPR